MIRGWRDLGSRTAGVEKFGCGGRLVGLEPVCPAQIGTSAFWASPVLPRHAARGGVLNERPTSHLVIRQQSPRPAYRLETAAAAFRLTKLTAFDLFRGEAACGILVLNEVNLGVNLRKAGASAEFFSWANEGAQEFMGRSMPASRATVLNLVDGICGSGAAGGIGPTLERHGNRARREHCRTHRHGASVFKMHALGVGQRINSYCSMR